MKQKRNSIMRGASGSLGDELVFRQRAGQTIISLPPTPTTKAPTAGQTAVMEKFKAAIGYAKVAIKDPELRAAYTLIAPAGTSGFNMAFSDFYSSPEIVSTDVSDFRNNGYVLVQAKDDFRVASVTVTLLNGEGTALESGEAISTPESGELWSYNATGATTDAVSLRIEVRDLPGNVTAQELPLAA